MGMDVDGKDPASEVGEYFRLNVWYWHPLADYILTVAPKAITDQCFHWHSNDGDGLDAKASKELAAFLQGELASGRTDNYIAARERMLNAMPNESCHVCGGTGRRPNGAKGWCMGCDGRGYRRPWACSYHLTIRSVTEFAQFLADCGGFEIN